SDFDGDAQRRDLQLEARAHIRVQQELDHLHAAGQLGEPAAVEHVRWLHRAFYADATPGMLRVTHPTGDFALTPGEFRSEPRHDNAVGQHVPPSSERVPEFMAHFAKRYRFEPLGRASQVVAMAASHHRLNYIHPFIDGNGRVSRLMSHAMALKAGIGANGLWSISRGLARGLVEPSEYKSMMDMADSPRRGDLDGRGNLSRQALIAFVTWFLQVARDQLRFMRELFDLGELSTRLRAYVVQTLHGNDAAVALAVETLRRGELARGDAGPVTGRPERTARAALSKLLESGLLASETPKGPVRVRFPIASVEALFPRLFPAQAGLV
ncbi:MAG: hypothetical protein RLZZ450_7046, partial [Pseudomonadota bacterium]